MTPAITITVPSTANVRERITPDAHHARVNEVAGLLSRMFGGATARGAQGFYVASDGKTVSEPVAEVTAYAPDGLTPDARARLRGRCAKWADDWGQECVLINLAGSVEFVEPLSIANAA